ncbi:hypothetical protein ACJX0J_008878, partial [Zea mays]
IYFTLPATTKNESRGRLLDHAHQDCNSNTIEQQLLDISLSNISSHDTKGHSAKARLRPSDSGNSNNVGVVSLESTISITFHLQIECLVIQEWHTLETVVWVEYFE